MSWQTDWSVHIAAMDMTDAMRPFLTSLSVTLSAGGANDRCDLTFDDNSGQLVLPPVDGPVSITLDGVVVFDGILDGAVSRGDRDGGRLMVMRGKGMAPLGKAREVQHLVGEGDFGVFLEMLAAAAGCQLRIDPEFAEIKRDHWSANRESFHSFGSRMADEFGATFKINDTQAVFVRQGVNYSLPIIYAAAGENLLSWSIAPKLTRRRWSGAQAEYFDRRSASFVVGEIVIDGEDRGIVTRAKALAGGADAAREYARGRHRESHRADGGGTLSMDLAPDATPEGRVSISGARQGVDGQWRIVSLAHKTDRGGGATTELKLKEPSPVPPPASVTARVTQSPTNIVLAEGAD